MSNSEKWSEYWANEGSSGEVFVNKNGKKHPHLTQFWQQQLSQFKTGSRIIDLASGAGSIFSELPTLDDYKLYAADISATALKQLKSRIPRVTTIECSAARVPADDGEFDLVVSQFGIEYAGQQAFAEAARLLSANGKLIMLCHYEDGFIDSRNKVELAGAKLIDKLDFVSRAIDITKASFSADKEAFEQALNAFTAVEPQLSEYVSSHNGGIHSHLYFGFQQLYKERNQYAVEDIIQWLMAIKAQIAESVVRLTEMRSAAQSNEQMNNIVNLLKDLGLTELECKPFVLPGNETPVAWQLSGTKV